MEDIQYKIKAELWEYPGKAAWHFITVPKNNSKEITELFGEAKRGWGSLPVNVIIGKSKWKTSIFPDKKTGTYLLPVKAEIRKSENIVAGDNVDVLINIII